MKKSIKLGLVASALMAVSGLVSAQANGHQTRRSPRKPVCHRPAWRRSSAIRSACAGVRAQWSVERAAAAKIEGAKFPNWTAGCECDKDLMKAPIANRRRRRPPPAAAPPPPPPPPPAPPAPTSEKVTFAADALFDFDKAVLRPEGKAKMDDLVSKLAGVSLEVIIGVGYTDRIGSLKHNHGPVACVAPQAVKDYLVSKGIEPNRVYTEGKGPANPVKQCPDPSPKGEIRNRQAADRLPAAEPPRRGRGRGHPPRPSLSEPLAMKAPLRRGFFLLLRRWTGR